MEQEELHKMLQSELGKIVKKYKLKNCAICGQTEDDLNFGTPIGNMTKQDVFNTALNVGRLWQHFRGLTRDMLNKFEKEKWK